MEKAIRTTSQLGFMLRDMEYELCSRFVDELLLHDKHAKVLGDTDIPSRAKLSACIGEGNKRLLQVFVSWACIYTDKTYTRGNKKSSNTRQQ